MWPGAASRSGGKATRHCSLAWGQRGANVHPSATPMSEGTTPGISVSRRDGVDDDAEDVDDDVDSAAARLSRGIDVIRPRV